MFRKAKWTAYEHYDAPIVVKNFRAQKQSGRSELAVCGLGFYCAFLNGKRIGDAFYQPAQTDYEPRDLSSMLYPVSGGFRHRIYYNVYDVTELLADGENELAIMLGNGWYRQKDRVCEGHTEYDDRLKLIFELTLADGGRVFSDGACEYTESEIRASNIYTGETQDFLFEKIEKYRAIEIDPPKAEFEKQPSPPDRVYERFTASRIAELPGGRAIYDVGKNIAGRAIFRSAREQECVTARYAEERYPDGTLDFSTTSLGSSQIQTDKFYHVSKGQSLSPLFAPHAFRYIEVEGDVDEVTAEAIATDCPCVADFSCSDERLNWLFRTARDTVRAGYHGSIPVDCPHRERLGYTADGQLAAETALLMLDSAPLYEKWLRDIADGQSEAGEVRNTAPFEGGGGGPVGWGGAIVTLCHALYRVTGELRAARTFFPAMRGWCEFIANIRKNGVVCSPREGVWFLGEWCTPEDVRLPPSFVNTCLYVRYLTYYKQLCRLLSEPFEFENILTECRSAIKELYGGNGYFGNDQGAAVFAWAAGLSDDGLRAEIIKKYETSPLDTGIFGTQLLFDFFAEAGRYDLIAAHFSRSEYPSYGYWMRRGATTFWETWRGDGAVSHNHSMFAAPVKHLFYSIGGLAIDPAEKTVAIRPRYAGVDEVNYSLRPFGKKLDVSFKFVREKLAYCRIEAEGKAFFGTDNKDIPINKTFILDGEKL